MPAGWWARPEYLRRPRALNIPANGGAVPSEVRPRRLRSAQSRLLASFIAGVPRERTAPSGRVWVATPATTVLDLVDDPDRSGGLSNAATVIAERADDNRLTHDGTTGRWVMAWAEPARTRACSPSTRRSEESPGANYGHLPRQAESLAGPAVSVESPAITTQYRACLSISSFFGDMHTTPRQNGIATTDSPRHPHVAIASGLRPGGKTAQQASASPFGL